MVAHEAAAERVCRMVLCPGAGLAAGVGCNITSDVRVADEESTADAVVASRQASRPPVRRSDAELDRFMAQATQRDRRAAGGEAEQPEQDDAPQRSFDDMSDR